MKYQHQEVIEMFYGYGRGSGFGRSGGMGLGFRGSSPPWPYVGRGRGGLPRCGYYLGTYAGPRSGREPFYPGVPYYPRVTREEELNYMKNQAEAIKGQLEEIESRMHELENKRKETE
jgi:hypothetical protein